MFKIELQKPLEWCYITQPFGVNWTGIPDAYTRWGMTAHNGIDFKLHRRWKVKTAHSGIITKAKFNQGFGWYIEITDVSGRFKTRYAHAEKLLKQVGDYVTAGEVIMLGDSTGFSTGDHLHFDLKFLDRYGNVEMYDNGYYGAVDPAPYMVKGWDNLPVDEYYGERRTWSKFLIEKGIAFNPWLIKKLGRLPNNREIKMLAYGHWSFIEMESESFRPITNWLTKPAYKDGEKPYIKQSI